MVSRIHYCHFNGLSTRSYNGICERLLKRTVAEIKFIQFLPCFQADRQIYWIQSICLWWMYRSAFCVHQPNIYVSIFRISSMSLCERKKGEQFSLFLFSFIFYVLICKTQHVSKVSGSAGKHWNHLICVWYAYRLCIYTYCENLCVYYKAAQE